ncbi:3'(2'),5'-bisphosphate nucleotidase CysQ [Syntrophobacter fumaroxidans]|uniref:3'(2'),5'-bisphosphate nucleotidase CysQ n=1 Tax=Syntrophobacter fumaroxidans TaxID=119484 RepID=UPI00338E5944
MTLIDLDHLSELAVTAGEAILEIYGTEFSVESKEDKSPLTLADKRSHRIIVDALRSRYPDIPVLSEEGREVPYAVRREWSRFWLVDPLDGTKEFVKRNGEFTVNIALIDGVNPVVGVILVPVLKRLFLADVGRGCWEIVEGRRRPLRIPAVPDGTVRIVESRSHPSPGLEPILKLLPAHEIVSRGSALKFCSVAAGEADFYPRFGPTWEWDTAAGQAIVTAAGGTVIDFKGKPFVYNKENLVNGPFLAIPSLHWARATGILEAVSRFDSAK